MKHKHYDMICAKAANMELIRFTKLDDNQGSEWIVQADNVQNSTQFNEQAEYFLCLPRHKEAVLNLLNGGDSQANFGERWSACNLNEPTEWNPSWWYMNKICKSRIKPRKDEFSELLSEFGSEKPISEDKKESLIYKLIECLYGSGVLIKFTDITQELK